MKKIINKIINDNPVFRLASRQSMKTGTLCMALPFIILFFICFIIVSYAYAASSDKMEKMIHIAFPDLALIGFNIIFMVLILTIIVGQQSLLNLAKKQLAYDQTIMTGLSPWTWFVGSLSALFRNYCMILVYLLPACCFLCLLNILPLVLIPVMIVTYTCFFINIAMIILLLERGVFNFFSIAGCFCILPFIIFPISLLMMDKQTVTILKEHLYLLAYMNPTTFSITHFQNDYPMKSLMFCGETPISMFSLVSFFIFSHLTFFLISLAYLILGKDYRYIPQDKFQTIIHISNTQALAQDINVNGKKELLEAKINDECRKFQENHFPYILKNANWLRAILNIVVLCIITLIYVKCLHQPFKNNNIFVFFLLVIPLFPLISLGINIIKAVPVDSKNLKEHLKETGINLIYPIGQIAVLLFIFLFIGIQLSCLENDADVQMGTYFQPIMNYTLLVIVTVAIFATIHVKKSFWFFLYFMGVWCMLIPLGFLIYSAFVNEFDFVQFMGASSPLLAVLHYHSDIQQTNETCNHFTTYCSVIACFFTFLTIALSIMKRVKPGNLKKTTCVAFCLFFLHAGLSAAEAQKDTNRIPDKSLFEQSSAILQSLNEKPELTHLWPNQGYGYIVFATLLLLTLYLYLTVKVAKQKKNNKFNFKKAQITVIIFLILIICFKFIFTRQPRWDNLELQIRQNANTVIQWRYYSTLVTTTAKIQLPEKAQGFSRFENKTVSPVKNNEIKAPLLSRVEIGKLEKITDDTFSGITGKVLISPNWNQIKLSIQGKIPKSIRKCCVLLSSEVTYPTLLSSFNPDELKNGEIFLTETKLINNHWYKVLIQTIAPQSEACLVLFKKEDIKNKGFKAAVIPIKIIYQIERSGRIRLEEQDRLFILKDKRETTNVFFMTNTFLSNKDIENKGIIINLSYTWNLTKNYQHNSSAIIEIKQQGQKEWTALAKLEYKKVSELSDQEVTAQVQMFRDNGKFGESIEKKKTGIPGVIDQKKPIIQLRIKQEAKGPELRIYDINIKMKYWVINYD